MGNKDLDELDKIALMGLAHGDENIPSSYKMTPLQIFVIIMLIVLIGMIIFTSD